MTDSMPSWLQTNPQEWGHLAAEGARLDIERQQVVNQVAAHHQAIEQEKQNTAIQNQVAQQRMKQAYDLASQRENVAAQYKALTLQQNQEKIKAAAAAAAQNFDLRNREFQWRQQNTEESAKAREDAASKRFSDSQISNKQKALDAIGKDISKVGGQLVTLDPQNDKSKIEQVRRQQDSLLTQRSTLQDELEQLRKGMPQSPEVQAQAPTAGGGGMADLTTPPKSQPPPSTAKPKSKIEILAINGNPVEEQAAKPKNDSAVAPAPAPVAPAASEAAPDAPENVPKKEFTPKQIRAMDKELASIGDDISDTEKKISNAKKMQPLTASDLEKKLAALKRRKEWLQQPWVGEEPPKTSWW